MPEKEPCNDASSSSSSSSEDECMDEAAVSLMEAKRAKKEVKMLEKATKKQAKEREKDAKRQVRPVFPPCRQPKLYLRSSSALQAHFTRSSLQRGEVCVHS